MIHSGNRGRRQHALTRSTFPSRYTILLPYHQAVYDPFLGSGTTVIAAEQTGRTCRKWSETCRRLAALGQAGQKAAPPGANTSRLQAKLIGALRLSLGGDLVESRTPSALQRARGAGALAIVSLRLHVSGGYAVSSRCPRLLRQCLKGRQYSCAVTHARTETAGVGMNAILRPPPSGRHGRSAASPLAFGTKLLELCPHRRKPTLENIDNLITNLGRREGGFGL